MQTYGNVSLLGGEDSSSADSLMREGVSTLEQQPLEISRGLKVTGGPAGGKSMRGGSQRLIRGSIEIFGMDSPSGDGSFPRCSTDTLR